MVAIPAFSDFLFVSAAALNNASSVVASGVEDITGSLFTTGIVNSPSLLFSPSSLVVTVTFGPTVRCIFSSGVMAGGFGNTNGVINGVYSVDMSSLVPGTGSVTAYIAASASQIGQQSTLITGPSPGHPDYDPTFVPYTAYLETLDTLTLTATTTPPDNSTSIELCRILLTAGESSISSVTTTYQALSNTVNGPVYAIDNGATNALSVIISPDLVPLRKGQVIYTAAAHKNTGGTTLSVNGSIGLSVLNTNGTALLPGQIQAGGFAYVIFNSINWELLSPSMQTWSTIGTFNISAVSSYNIALPTNYSRFRLTIESGVVSTAGNNISLQFSSNGGSTFLTAANYTYIQNVTDNLGNNTNVGTLTATSVPLSVLMGANTLSAPWDGTFNIWPGNSSSAPRIYGQALGDSSTGVAIGGMFFGSWGGTSAVMNYIKLLTASGTFTCTAILEGLV